MFAGNFSAKGVRIDSTYLEGGGFDLHSHSVLFDSTTTT